MAKFLVGDIAENIVPVEHEDGTIVPVGTKLRIVAIAPKVRMTNYLDEYHDKSPYFYNAVLATQENDYHNRIRENFCTIKKVKK